MRAAAADFLRPSCRKGKSAQEMKGNPSDRNEQEVSVLESERQLFQE